MDALDDPFAAVEAELSACPLREGADAIVVDMHAEATSEKMAMGQFLRRARELCDRHAQPCPDARTRKSFRNGTGLSDGCGRLRRL